MSKQATLKDIAEKAKVSISTVSRVINGNIPKSASKEVQDKIWKVAKELDYTPNFDAQSLKRGKNKLSDKPKIIACIFSRSENTQNDPFFSEISRALEAELMKQGYILKYSISTISASSTILKNFLSEPTIEGVVILGRIDENTLTLIKKMKKYVVYVGLNRLKYDVDQVICDGYDAAKMAIEYLRSTGIDKIYYLGECENEARFTSFKDNISRFIPQNEFTQYVIPSPFNIEEAYHRMIQFLENGQIPEGLFCGNDSVAIGALKALQEKGITIPGQTSVIGIDDIEMAQFSTPMLTTIGVPKEQLGRKAARFIVDRIVNGNDINVIMQIPMKLIKRETTK